MRYQQQMMKQIDRYNQIYTSTKQHQMAEEQIEQLKNKLQSQAMEFQNYKAECKQLEQFLEEQSNKKEDQIRKLKEEAIKKQKNYNLLKTQVSQMETEIATLKSEAKQKEGASVNNEENEKQMASLKQEISKLLQEKDGLKSQLEKALEENKKIEKLEETIQMRESIIKDLQLQISKVKAEKSHQKSQKKEEKSPAPASKIEKPAHEQKSSKNNEQIKLLNKRLAESRQETEKTEENLIKLSKQMKEMKQKMQYMSADRDKLTKKVKQLSFTLAQKKQQTMKIENFDEEQIHESNQNESINLKDNFNVSALIMTKKHYVSPFLEFKGENTIKLYRSTKNGCFEKSLGSFKFKLHQITYETENILNQCAKTIQQNLHNGTKTSIVFYGAKRTTKKYLMANLVQKLKQTMINLIDGAEEHPRAQFIKASPDPQKKAQFSGKDREEVIEIIDRIIALGQKSPKKHDNNSKKKGHSKPKVRFFSFGLGDENYLEIMTSSHTNIFSRQTTNVFDALNNICYSKLPNSLQTVDSQKILVLTINPIVSLYEDCRNTLSIVNCKKIINSENSTALQWQGSPIKDDMLNDTARKKLQSIERDNEQYNLKARRLEEDILFYRSKFDDLEVRLKNLLNTHGGHNSYLKKSPVTLSYEKMLKFVHSVLARNGPTLTHSPALNKTSDFHNNDSFNIDEGYGSGQEIL